MNRGAYPHGGQLVADAHQALRDAHRRLLDATPQGIDCARAAFATAVDRLGQLHGLLYHSPDAGRGLLPAMTGLHAELETVTLLLQRAAWHQSNLLQRMLQASSRVNAGVDAGVDAVSYREPLDTGRRFEVSA